MKNKTVNASLKTQALAFSSTTNEKRKSDKYRNIRELSIEHLPRHEPSTKAGASDFLFSQLKFSSCTVRIPRKQHKKAQVFIRAL